MARALLRWAKLWLATLMPIMACGSGGSGSGDCGKECEDKLPVAGAPRLSVIQSEFFGRSCATSSCHDANRPVENLDLSTPETAFADLVGVDSNQVEKKRVDPGNPAGSYLLDKLRGVNLGRNSEGEDSTLMPQGLCAPACENIIAPIEQWIAEGALDN